MLHLNPMSCIRAKSFNFINVLAKRLKSMFAYQNLLFILIVMFANNISFAQSQIKYSNVKIYMPKDPAQRLDLIGMLEIDHFHEHDGAFNYTVDQQQLQLLKASGVKHEILHDDAIAYLAAENEKYYQSLKSSNNSGNRVAFEQTNSLVDSIIKTPSSFVVQPTFGGYYSFAQMVAAIDTVVARYPTITQKFSIGNSTEGRPLWCLKISDNVTTDESEPEILFMGHHHAREAIGGASMIFLMQYLCENYVTGNRIKDLVDNREIFIIVCANPDGWEWNRTQAPTGGFQWRKNRRVNGSGQFGVDLNRNWGVNWANCTGAIGASSCGSATTSSDTYWGPSQYSEPETRALRLFCRSRDFGAVMDQHSVGPYYSLPWGRLPPHGVTMSAIDDAVYTQMASVMGKYNGMRYGSTYQTLGYEVSGGMKDVLLKGDDSLPNGKCYGMTGEGSNGSSATSFWPLAADIVRLCKGMVYQDIQLIYTVGSYVDLQDSTRMNIQTNTGNLYFSLRRIGLGSLPVTVTAIPILNVFSVGAAKTVSAANLPNFNSMYKDSITYTLSSSIAPGNVFRYAWKIETGGYTYYDTITAIYQPNVIFTDNMESGVATTNWTINSGWAYTTDAAYTGTRSLAESPGANYADNAHRIAQKATNINLSGAGSAYLTFWVKSRSENFRDLLRVEVSTNGTTWVAIPGRTTVRQPGTSDGSQVRDTASLTGINNFWSREVFDLRNYLGQTNLRLRFRFKADAGGTTYVYDNDMGFNIDDISILAGGSPTALPVELTNFTGRNEDDINILNWNTASELNTKEFIIERSTNSVDYEAIGTVAAAGNSSTSKFYTFTDKSPYSGDNLYRLKMVDLDGTYKYSKIVLLRVEGDLFGVEPTGISTLYPNPATGRLFVNFNVADQAKDYNMTVFNNVGQIVYNQMLKLEIGSNQIELDATYYEKGTYFITFNNVSKGISYEKTFIKL